MQQMITRTVILCFVDSDGKGLLGVSLTWMKECWSVINCLVGFSDQFSKVEKELAHFLKLLGARLCDAMNRPALRFS